jgi:hypothetical protein
VCAQPDRCARAYTSTVRPRYVNILTWTSFGRLMCRLFCRGRRDAARMHGKLGIFHRRNHVPRHAASPLWNRRSWDARGRLRECPADAYCICERLCLPQSQHNPPSLLKQSVQLLWHAYLEDETPRGAYAQKLAGVQARKHLFAMEIAGHLPPVRTWPRLCQTLSSDHRRSQKASLQPCPALNGTCARASGQQVHVEAATAKLVCTAGSAQGGA